jgi:tetratricopeptide (TPR) repeat protein
MAAKLTIGLAEALDRLHQEKLIHRDFKPQNVLLEAPEDLRDDESGSTDPPDQDAASRSVPGAPKIIDFGLAKPLEAEERLTVSGAIVGTPEYMAPEQAVAEDWAQVSVAADVYALGATLYHCLTGRPPFKAATHAQTLRALAEDEPVPPSRLNGSVPRDLELICLKCLEKRPARRYASAQHLADDLQRFCAGEPIEARPHSRLEKSRRWIRRHPAATIGLASVFLAAVFAFAGVVVHNQSLSKQIELTEAENREANRQRERADRNYHHARQTMREMLSDTDAYTSVEIPRMLTLIESQAQSAIGFLAEISLSSESPPVDVLIDLIETYEQLGNAQVLLGKGDAAQKSFQLAVETAAELCRIEPDQPGHRLLLAEARIKRAYAADLVGLATEAIVADLFETIEILEGVLGDDPDSVGGRSTLAWARHQLGTLQLAKQKDPEAAADQFRGASELRLELMDRDPAQADLYAQSAAESQVNLGLCFAQLGQYQEALEHYAGADATLAQFLIRHPNDPQTAISRCKNGINRASLLLGLGKPQESIEVSSAGLEGVLGLLANEPDHVELGECLFKSLGVRAQANTVLGKWADGARDWKDARSYAPDPIWEQECRVQEALCLTRLGLIDRPLKLCSETLGDEPGDDTIYNCVCVLALVAATLFDDAADEGNAENKRQASERQAVELKQQAIELLQSLQQAGYFDHEARAAHVQVDADLEALRDPDGTLPLDRR